MTTGRKLELSHHIPFQNPMDSRYTSYPIPCHDLFQSVVTYGFVVDGLLHRLRLKNSLERLVRHWIILGARIGKDSQGVFEYRVPSAFNDEVEAFTFDSQVLSSPLSDHFRIPPATPEPSIFTPSSATIFQPPAHLRRDCLSQYESASQPILHLQIVQFSDEKTSVGFTIPRCFCDAWGMKEILSTWSSILASGEITADVPGLVEDTMVLEKVHPQFRNHFHSGQLPADTFTEEDCEIIPRWLFMPTETLANLTRACRDQLGSESDKINQTDVLLAWWAKVVYSTNLCGIQYPPLQVSIHLHLRTQLSASTHKAHLHNAVHMATHTFSSSSSLAEMPLPQLALTFGKTILSVTSQEVTHGLAHSTNDHSVVAPPSSEEFVLNTDCALEDCIDFRPALMDRIDASQSFASGRVTGRRRGSARLNRAPPEKIGSGETIWVDVTAQSSHVAKATGVVVRKDEKGVWVKFSLIKWRWSKGLLGEMCRD
ncbi:hypothetical protein C8R45DRAFT_953006 [Mycena sanguinolenta]|nr:hypothetical protein C8R45DRAFT_953006 [Mycena sanguinolenta]